MFYQENKEGTGGAGSQKITPVGVARQALIGKGRDDDREKARLKFNTQFLTEKTTSAQLDEHIEQASQRFDCAMARASGEKTIVSFIGGCKKILNPSGALSQTLPEQFSSEVEDKIQEWDFPSDAEEGSAKENIIREYQQWNLVRREFLKQVIRRESAAALTGIKEVIEEAEKQGCVVSIASKYYDKWQAVVGKIISDSYKSPEEALTAVIEILVQHAEANKKDGNDVELTNIAKKFNLNAEYQARIEADCFTRSEKIQTLTFGLRDLVEIAKKRERIKCFAELSAFVEGKAEVQQKGQPENELEQQIRTDARELLQKEKEKQKSEKKGEESKGEIKQQKEDASSEKKGGAEQLADLMILATPDEIRKTFVAALYQLSKEEMNRLIGEYFPQIDQENDEAVDRPNTVVAIFDEFLSLERGNVAVCKDQANFLARRCLSGIVAGCGANDKIASFLYKLIRERYKKEAEAKKDLEEYIARKLAKYSEHPGTISEADALTVPFIQSLVADGSVRMTDVISRAWANTTFWQKLRATIKYLRCIFLLKFTKKEYTAEEIWKSYLGQMTLWQRIQYWTFAPILALGKIATSVGAIFVLAPGGVITGEVVQNAIGNGITCAVTRGTAFARYYSQTLEKAKAEQHKKARTKWKDMLYFLVAFIAVSASAFYGAAFLVSGKTFLDTLLGLNLALINPWVLVLAVIAMLSYNTFYLYGFGDNIKEFYKMLKEHPVATVVIGLVLVLAQFALYKLLMAHLIIFPTPLIIVAAAILTVAGLFSIIKKIISFFVGKEAKLNKETGKYQAEDIPLEFADKTFFQKMQVIAEFFTPLKLIFNPLKEWWSFSAKLWRGSVTKNHGLAALFGGIWVPLVSLISLPFICFRQWTFDNVQKFVERGKEDGAEKGFWSFIWKCPGDAFLCLGLSLTLVPFCLTILDCVFPKFSRYFVLQTCKAISKEISQRPWYKNLLLSPYYLIKFGIGCLGTILTSPLALGWLAWRDIKAYAVQGSLESGHKLFDFWGLGAWLDHKICAGFSLVVGTVMAMVYNVGNAFCFTWGWITERVLSWGRGKQLSPVVPEKAGKIMVNPELRQLLTKEEPTSVTSWRSWLLPWCNTRKDVAKPSMRTTQQATGSVAEEQAESDDETMSLLKKRTPILVAENPIRASGANF